MEDSGWGFREARLGPVGRTAEACCGQGSGMRWTRGVRFAMWNEVDELRKDTSGARG
uniref:Uncharacterized protein n=1 Tax=Arundo donax TaxID=35708 RepID=A0A0A9EIC2_ARUDO